MDRRPRCIIQSQVWEERGIRLCLLDAPSAFSKLPCLLGTSSQTDAVLSALGNPRGLWVFCGKATHTCAHTRGLIKASHTNTDQIKPLEKHICVLISCCDSQECSLICWKKKTLSQHIIGEPDKAKKTSQPPHRHHHLHRRSDTISLLLRESAFRRDQCYQSKLICFDWSLMWPQSSGNYCLDGCAPAS